MTYTRVSWTSLYTRFSFRITFRTIYHLQGSLIPFRPSWPRRVLPPSLGIRYWNLYPILLMTSYLILHPIPHTFYHIPHISYLLPFIYCFLTFVNLVLLPHTSYLSPHTCYLYFIPYTSYLISHTSYRIRHALYVRVSSYVLFLILTSYLILSIYCQMSLI